MNKKQIILTILIIVILELLYYKSYQQDKFPFGKDACENIRIIKGDSYFDYPPLRELINYTEFITSGKISSWNSKGSWIGNNYNYINCRFPATICFPSTYENSYCQNIELNLIVNYPIWKEWKKQETRS